MAGHSHWANIKHKKAANDAKKATVANRMARLLKGAIQIGGPEPNENPRLRLAISKARAQNMTSEAIQRIIKRAAGEASGPGVEVLVYEGYGAGGVAVVVEVLTNNRNRTAAEIRKIFERGGGSLGPPGCVSWQFHEKCAFAVNGSTEDAVLEALLAGGADAEDIHAMEDGGVEITGKPGDYDAIAAALAAAKLTVSRSDVTKIADNDAAVATLETAQTVQRLLDTLEEQEDVTEVQTNFAPTPEVAAKL